jgi:hypothetical protein
VGHPRLRHWHLVRAHRLIPRVAGLALLAALVAALAACGSGGSADATSACMAAQAKLAPVQAATNRPSAADAARAAGAAFAQLSLALSRLGGPSPDPEALANLRNAASVAALDYRDLAALLVQPGSGLLGPLRLQGVAAYAQIDAAAAQLGAPACTARDLGRPLFDALVARTTAPAGPDLATAAQTACTDIGAAYGASQVAIDQRAALTQLQRSVAVLGAARNDLADVTGTAGAHLRSAIDAAIAVLSAANHAVDHGADPAAATTRAFDQATAQLRDGFRSAGVVCPVPGA